MVVVLNIHKKVVDKLLLYLFGVHFRQVGIDDLEEGPEAERYSELTNHSPLEQPSCGFEQSLARNSVSSSLLEVPES